MAKTAEAKTSKVGTSSETKQDVFTNSLTNLREKVVDKGVCGAEEMVELIDALLVVSTGTDGTPEPAPIPDPPNEVEKIANTGSTGNSSSNSEVVKGAPATIGGEDVK